jgi:hypothetical protein
MRISGIVAITALLACAQADEEAAPERTDSVPVNFPAVEPMPPTAEPATSTTALRSALEKVVPDAVVSAVIDSAGHVIVDFKDLRMILPNASSSAGSTALIAQLNAAVFGIPEARSVEYRMQGSCDLFWEWLQYGCHTITAEEYQAGTP